MRTRAALVLVAGLLGGCVYMLDGGKLQRDGWKEEVREQSKAKASVPASATGEAKPVAQNAAPPSVPANPQPASATPSGTSLDATFLAPKEVSSPAQSRHRRALVIGNATYALMRLRP